MIIFQIFGMIFVFILAVMVLAVFFGISRVGKYEKNETVYKSLYSDRVNDLYIERRRAMAGVFFKVIVQDDEPITERRSYTLEISCQIGYWIVIYMRVFPKNRHRKFI